MFDVLLGLKKSHRQFVFDNLKNHNLLERNFVSILDSVYSEEPRNQYYSPELYSLESPEGKQTIDAIGAFNSYHCNVNSNTLHRFDTVHNSVSQQVPWLIYNNSYYTIVAETLENISTYFFTEKTAKPLFAKRLFIVFGSQGHLKNLKNLGFKTFDTIIDESYDSESDPIRRWEKAFEQVLLLHQLDPVIVYDQIKDILEHNHNLICDIDHFRKPLLTWLTHKLS